MKNEIQSQGSMFSYTVKSIRKSKSVRVIVHGDGTVVLTKPLWVSTKQAKGFLQGKIDWIMDRIRLAKETASSRVSHQGTREEYESFKEKALQFVKERTSEINQEFYGFDYARISIRNQKTRWGSCSKKGNLSFHYRIVSLAPKCADYLIAHELCHLKEFNHSEQFWKLVAKAIPEYRTIRREMR